MPKKVYEQPKVGDKFGRYEILEIYKKPRNDGRYRKMAKCKCQCGEVKNVATDSLIKGLIKSCGCYNIEIARERLIKYNTKHGLCSNHLLLVSRFHKIIDRCFNEKNRAYKNYGGRGISVCNEWNPRIVGMEKAIVSFVEWSLVNGYSNGLEIDRKNNNEGYSPDNCRWVTTLVNAQNKRNNRLYTYQNETKTVSAWSRDSRCVVSYNCLIRRLNKGMDISFALTSPSRPFNRKIGD